MSNMRLLQMSIAGAVMILAIIIIRAITINRLPKKVFVLLWEVVLLRLLIPFSIPSMLSAYSFVGRKLHSTLSESAPVQDVLNERPIVNFITEEAAGLLSLSTEPSVGLQNNEPVFPIRTFVWIVGMMLCAAFFLIAYLRSYFEFRTSLPVQNEFAAKWLEKHRLKRPIQIRQSGRISAPLTYGILKPVILMPQKTNWENREELEYVLLHEYLHICRFDIVMKLIVTLALCIHWFNPFVWCMYLLFNRDIELSCDESVVWRFGENSKATYARTLITLEEKKSGFTPLVNNFSKNAIEERITAIMKTKKATIWAIGISVVILVVIMVLFATSAEREEENSVDNLGVVLEGIEVSEVVLEAAKQLVGQNYSDLQDGNYNNWRIEALSHTYTYDNFEGMTLEVYCLNYEFLAIDPDKVTLAGGMTIDEEGWVMPGYPDCTYLVFWREGEVLSYLTWLMENDCAPGDEIFTNDLSTRISSRYAAIIKEITENTITVDIVEFVTDDDVERKKELIEELGLIEQRDLSDGNFLNGYYLHNPDTETTEWQLTDETIYTFIDWDRKYSGEYIDEYTTTDGSIFREYVSSYIDAQSTMPFFFRVEEGVVKNIHEKGIP